MTKGRIVLSRGPNPTVNGVETKKRSSRAFVHLRQQMAVSPGGLFPHSIILTFINQDAHCELHSQTYARCTS